MKLRIFQPTLIHPLPSFSHLLIYRAHLSYPQRYLSISLYPEYSSISKIHPLRSTSIFFPHPPCIAFYLSWCSTNVCTRIQVLFYSPSFYSFFFFPSFCYYWSLAFPPSPEPGVAFWYYYHTPNSGDGAVNRELVGTSTPGWSTG